VRDDVIRLKAAGLSYACIAAELNARGVLSPGGKSWTKGKVFDFWHTRHVAERFAELERA
jgi:hypothetical protein